MRTRFALMLNFRKVALNAACHTYSEGFFKVSEDMEHILLTLEVLFKQDSVVEYMFCGSVIKLPMYVRSAFFHDETSISLNCRII